MNNKSKKYLAILSLALSGSVIYLLPYIKYVYYDLQIEAMGINNQQLGFLLSVYAIGCMILYVPGGIIADKISAKNGMIVSLVGTALLALIYGFTLSYKIAIVIWLLLAVTTGFVFWTSLMKSVRLIGTDDNQGSIFGMFYAVKGLLSAIIGYISLGVSTLRIDARGSLFNVILVYAFFNISAAIFVALFIKEDKAEKLEKISDKKFNMDDVLRLIKNPTVWIFSLVIFCGYGLHSSSSYFTPYLTNVIGASPEYSGFFSIIRTYIFMLLAPVGGYMADKVFKSTSKWFMVAFSLLGVFYVSIIFLPSNVSITVATIISLIPGALALMLYGIVFSIVSETKIPITVTATAIGIASIIGYAPDLFFSAMFGSWIDKYGNGGYVKIFMFLAFVTLIGLLSSYYIRRKSRNNSASSIEGEAM